MCKNVLMALMDKSLIWATPISTNFAKSGFVIKIAMDSPNKPSNQTALCKLIKRETRSDLIRLLPTQTKEQIWRNCLHNSRHSNLDCYLAWLQALKMVRLWVALIIMDRFSICLKRALMLVNSNSRKLNQTRNLLRLQHLLLSLSLDNNCLNLLLEAWLTC